MYMSSAILIMSCMIYFHLIWLLYTPLGFTGKREKVQAVIYWGQIFQRPIVAVKG